ncbi:MAG TPA: isochorismate synthase [Flavobacteriaceae bacterium]|nr:isochorismate synthase [Flavobacteriaceae bacterium]MCB9212573.1 isochorismate synthase [Alteromonas sp.]HPF10641.1 isochorismate synthase [Flavobacteriaceae bacterium]HQU20923.1 isochorismate synthase [Flavobacteriaceae bacterium]HQU64407.1 isochorismate synthase [Flavobacteriaceae bacterium]
MEGILEQVEKRFAKQLPFVIFSYPGNHEIEGFFQKNKARYKYNDALENGFIFQPFNADRGGFFIPQAQSEYQKGSVELLDAPAEKIVIPEAKVEKEAYKHLVSKAIERIQRRKAQKIVTSRCKTIALNSLSLPILIQRLFQLNPTAFRYVWFHPDTGLWAGATPELLLHSDGEQFQTMALAGTKENDRFLKVLWTEKEREEHQLVVDDIVSRLQQILSVLKVSKSTNHAAGLVVHLRTDISGCIKKGKASLYQIAQTLHPTPAVCGTPRKDALKFILEMEDFDREFYTGFLGPTNKASSGTQWFVNLRCMKLENQQAHIFVGGGITQGSVPEAEWLETQNKIQTMLQVLQPFL